MEAGVVYDLYVFRLPPSLTRLNQVSQNDLWPVIAAKIGFVQIAGSDTEPAKSGPVVAQHIRNVYRQFLVGFDNMFLQSISSITKPQSQQGGNMNNGVPNGGQQGTPGVQPNNASGSNGVGMANLTIPPGTDPKQITEFMAYARHSAEELRRQGYLNVSSPWWSTTGSCWRQVHGPSRISMAL